ncbi:hypothetical protein V492_06841 [Pseudogymnoascus sp. VKM F-4246]|nr:hypothetical protein V492_06841 [Pseudogymnoascus sp. VKM F-4246]
MSWPPSKAEEAAAAVLAYAGSREGFRCNFGGAGKLGGVWSWAERALAGAGLGSGSRPKFTLDDRLADCRTWTPRIAIDLVDSGKSVGIVERKVKKGQRRACQCAQVTLRNTTQCLLHRVVALAIRVLCSIELALISPAPAWGEVTSPTWTRKCTIVRSTQMANHRDATKGKSPLPRRGKGLLRLTSVVDGRLHEFQLPASLSSVGLWKWEHSEGTDTEKDSQSRRREKSPDQGERHEAYLAGKVGIMRTAGLEATERR